jgi:hypothetical protein
MTINNPLEVLSLKVLGFGVKLTYGKWAGTAKTKFEGLITLEASAAFGSWRKEWAVWRK